VVPKRKGQLLKIRLFCKVQPLARVRHDNNHSYQPKENQKELMLALAPYTALMKNEPIDYPVIIDLTLLFDRGTPGKSAHQGEYPTAPKFGDEDNLRKAMNDALVTAAIISNDRFVIGGETYKVFAEEDGAIINIWSIK